MKSVDDCIRDIIRKGESEVLELKKSTAQMEKALTAICAFLNHKGGTVYFGTYDAKITGQEVSDSTLKSISQKIRQRIKPEISPEVRVLELEGKNVIEVKIKEGNNKPYYLGGIAYKRVGSENVVIPPDEIERIILEKKRGHWDEQICEGATLADADEEKVRWFLQRRRKVREAPKALDIEGILASVGGMSKGRLTNAGILFFGKNPQGFFLQARIHCVLFEGIDVSRSTSDDKLFSGAIWEQVEQAEDFVRRNTKLYGFRTEYAFKRIDVPEYPPQAIREAIINALIHRDYEVPTEVKVFIFDDRIEITNPGTFPAGTTPEKPKHIPRNPILCQLMRDVEFIEKYGSGIYLIKEECKRLNAPEPVYEIDEYWTKIMLKSSGKDGVITEIEKTGVELNERQRQGMVHLFSEGKITAKAYCAINKVVPDTANRDLNGLLNLGLIKRIGKGRATYYVSAIG